MSRLLLLLILAASPLLAQKQQAGELAELERKRDSVYRLWREARDLVLLQDSLAHVAAVGRLDTLAVGHLRIITNRSPLPIRAAAEAVWPRLETFYGDAAVNFVHHPILIQAVDYSKQRKGFAPADRWGNLMPITTSLDELKRYLGGMFSLGYHDNGLNAWLSGNVVPRNDSLLSRDAYVSLVTLEYDSGRLCLEGDLRWCNGILGLNAQDPLAHLVTPADRRTQVRHLESLFRMQRVVDRYNECIADDDAACVQLLRTVTTSSLWSSTRSEGRQLVVALAIRIGGSGGYTRLIQDSTRTMAERLAYASGVPLDTLIGRWRNEVIAARPAPVSLSPVGLMIGLGWIALLGFLGTRSTRWRLG